MTIPAHITAAIRDGKMTYCGEAQLSNHGETARKGQYVEFFLDDGPDGNDRHPFKGLRTGREKGQRFGLIAVPLGDNDAVEASAAQEKRKPAETQFSLSRKICGRLDFQQYMWARDSFRGSDPTKITKEDAYMDCNARLKIACGVQSKAEFDRDPAATEKFNVILTSYEQSTNRMAERHD